MNDQSHGMFSSNSHIKFKTTMLKSPLCDYSDAWILFKGTITVFGEATNSDAIAIDRSNKQVISKNFALFTDCISEINYT